MVLAVALSRTGANPDDRDRDQRLHQRGCERQHDAALRGLLVGDQIGRDHRLAVTGPCGVKYSVSKRDDEQRPDRADRRTSRRGWSRTSRDKIPIVSTTAIRRCRRPAARRSGAGRRTGFAPSGRGRRCRAPAQPPPPRRQSSARAQSRMSASWTIHRDLVGEHRAVVRIVAAQEILLAELLGIGGAVVRAAGISSGRRRELRPA